MMAFLRAHGVDSGPLQRPVLAGLLGGCLACVPAGAILVAFGSFAVMADQVMRLPRAAAALVLLGAFAGSGALYGVLLRRAANDRRGGWLFGAAFGFLLWMAAPVVVLPLFGGSAMAAGTAATGFFVGFLVWGTTTGAIFPLVHRPLQGTLERTGDLAPPRGHGGTGSRVLRRSPRRWR